MSIIYMLYVICETGKEISKLRISLCERICVIPYMLLLLIEIKQRLTWLLETGGGGA